MKVFAALLLIAISGVTSDIKYIAKNGSLTSRIIGGQRAARNQFPYQALMFFQVNGEESLCSGSILTNNFILTAAHCVEHAAHVEIYFGVIDMMEEPPHYQNFPIGQNVIIHPNYNNVNYANDIALIRLQSRLTFTTGIQPMTLPTRAQSSLSFENSVGRVAGFGATSDRNPAPSNVLMFVDLPVISNAQCRTYFGSNVLLSSLCAFGPGRNTCTGDSGSPLTVTLIGIRVQVGIVSFNAAAGCEKPMPSVFTRITSYLDWIASNSDFILR